MNSETLLKVKNRLKEFLKDKKIIDIILFGSLNKGKTLPGDIDVAFITNKEIKPEIKSFHISLIKPEEFFFDQPSITHTILREGFSLRKNAFFSEGLRFNNEVLFTYNLNDKKPSEKVKIVNILHGKNKERGVVEDYKGKWLANQVFITPITSEHVIESLLMNLNIKFSKSYILMH